MQPALGVIILPRKSNVESDVRAVSVGILVHHGLSIGELAGAPDDGAGLVGQQFRGAEMIRVNVVEGFGAAGVDRHLHGGVARAGDVAHGAGALGVVFGQQVVAVPQEIRVRAIHRLAIAASEGVVLVVRADRAFAEVAQPVAGVVGRSHSMHFPGIRARRSVLHHGPKSMLNWKSEPK